MIQFCAMGCIHLASGPTPHLLLLHSPPFPSIHFHGVPVMWPLCVSYVPLPCTGLKAKTELRDSLAAARTSFPT